LDQLDAGAEQLIDLLDHVHGHPDRARLVGNGPANTLANPPGRVRGKFIASTPVKFIRAPHEADVAFLDQVQELQAAVGVFLRDGHNQAKVCLGHLFLCLLGFSFAPQDQGESTLQIAQPDLARFFDAFQLRAGQAQTLTRLSCVIALGHARTSFQSESLALERVKPLNSAPNLLD